MLLLRSAGVRIGEAAPSSSGTLIAGASLAAFKAVADPGEEDPLVAGLRGGLSGIRRRGKAEPGDRTMVDALAPALASLENAPQDHGAAARAAEQGVESTRTMQAKFGRARFLSVNAVGEPDPGAAMVGNSLTAALRAV